jgi:hypothetical protein
MILRTSTLMPEHVLSREPATFSMPRYFANESHRVDSTHESGHIVLGPWKMFKVG